MIEVTNRSGRPFHARFAGFQVDLEAGDCCVVTDVMCIYLFGWGRDSGWRTACAARHGRTLEEMQGFEFYSLPPGKKVKGTWRPV